MVLKSGQTYYFVAHFVSGGAAATGLTVEFRIYAVGSTTPTTVSATEMGDGLYYCSFTPTSDGEYIAVAHTTGTADQKDIPCYSTTAIPAKEEIDDQLSNSHGIGNWLTADISSLALESTVQGVKSQTDRMLFDDKNYIKANVQDKGVLNDPSAEDIESYLAEKHGSGNWESGGSTVNLISVLRMSEDEFVAYVGDQAKVPITVFRGDSLKVDIIVVDANGDAVDLTGATAKFTARKDEASEEAILTKDLIITDPSNGKMQLALTPDDTALTPQSYAADIEISFPDGRVKTVWKSQFVVKWDVTRS